jgi:hypothetical protein
MANGMRTRTSEELQEISEAATNSDGLFSGLSGGNRRDEDYSKHYPHELFKPSSDIPGVDVYVKEENGKKMYKPRGISDWYSSHVGVNNLRWMSESELKRELEKTWKEKNPDETSQRAGVNDVIKMAGNDTGLLQSLGIG